MPAAATLDVVFQAVGRPQTFAAAVPALGHGGVATVVGIPRPGYAVRLDLQRLRSARAARSGPWCRLPPWYRGVSEYLLPVRVAERGLDARANAA